MSLPTPKQLEWQRAEYGMFCHFGINTYYGKEWSDGTLSPASFNPTKFDARQWVETAQDAGMRYLILTAKHHDGFCLWPTETTDYSLAASPYREGKGDIVGEVAEACREAGLPFGLYLSPWDRHEPRYPDAEAYDRFYVRQLTELCTRYGPLVEVWFDGAGSVGRTYDWDAIMAVIDEHQPDAMVFNMGRPTIRWVGNEDGLAADPNPYVVQGAPGTGGYTDAYLAQAPRYLPPECDVSIRRGWFWHPQETKTLKSLGHLLGIYYRSVGLGANLLLNVPPNRDGLIAEEDRARLLELAAELKSRFAEPFTGKLEPQGGTVTVTFPEPVTFDHILVQEQLENGQHVTAHRILSDDSTVIAEGQTIGHKRLHVFPQVTSRTLRLELSGPDATLSAVSAYLTGFESLPQVTERVHDDPEAAAMVDWPETMTQQTTQQTTQKIP